MVVKSKDNFVDPISKRDIKNPVRNKLCNHVYEKETMFDILKKKKQMRYYFVIIEEPAVVLILLGKFNKIHFEQFFDRCPALGCSRQVFTIDDLEDDEETAAKISQRASQRQTASQLDTEEMGSDEEGMENTTIDPELDDTQSQELF